MDAESEDLKQTLNTLAYPDYEAAVTHLLLAIRNTDKATDIVKTVVNRAI